MGDVSSEQPSILLRATDAGLARVETAGIFSHTVPVSVVQLQDIANLKGHPSIGVL